MLSVQQDSQQAVRAICARIEQLHSPPEIAKMLLALADNDDANVERLTRCIATDPALVGKLLRVVNSPRYGMRQQVRSVAHAVILLGPRSVRLLALSFSILGNFTRGKNRQWYVAFWRQALTMGIASLKLAGRNMGLDRQEAYTAGLLADVGSLALASVLKQEYLDIVAKCSSSDALVTSERAALGYDHAQVGQCLLAKWGFPATLTSAIGAHHEPSPAADPLCATIHTAALMADFMWREGPGSAKALEVLKRRFGPDNGSLSDMLLVIWEELQSQSEDYGFHLPPEASWQALLAQAKQQSFDMALDATLTLDSFDDVRRSIYPCEGDG